MKERRFFNYLLTENCYVSGGPTNNGGVVFEWFTRQFGDFKNPFDIDQSMEELIAEASKVPVGSDGLIFLPYLLGERAPIWNANARGVYFGLNIKHERKHFVRATIEGILYEIYSIGKTLEEHRDIKSLSINGSFATIPFCTQMIADMFNKPVRLRRISIALVSVLFWLQPLKWVFINPLMKPRKKSSCRMNINHKSRNHAIYELF